MKLHTSLICLTLAFGVAACQITPHAENGASSGWIVGTVRHVELEGGFFGIVDEQGNRFDPVNLPERFEKDGLRVKFRMTKLQDRMSFHMWGTLVKITKIEKF
jgi:hypothetical protein